MNHQASEGIRLEFLVPQVIDGQPAESWVRFDRAVARGFHDPVTDQQERGVLAELDVRGASRYIAAYDQLAAAPSLHAQDPVGTYEYYPGSLNVGGPQLVPVHQVTAVTVSPTHRRRGILRSMMSAHLDAAAAEGIALAVLTASEATIYGRFGFGPAAERCRFELAAGQGARLRVPATGTVVAVEPGQIRDEVQRLYRAHHEVTLGSVSHNGFDIGRATGRWESYENLKPAANLRAALHLDANGVADGFMTYTFDGWKKDPPTMSISTLCTVTAAARRELVAYLCDHDLVERVTGRAPVDDVVPTALYNARDYRVTARGDHLWLRILDLPAALQARSYRGEASLVLEVEDALGHAAGRWRLQAGAGAMRVEPAPGQVPDARLDVRDLATLYLGTRSATHLAGAGLLTGHRPGTLRLLDALFVSPEAPYCQVDF